MPSVRDVLLRAFLPDGLLGKHSGRSSGRAGHARREAAPVASCPGLEKMSLFCGGPSIRVTFTASDLRQHCKADSHDRPPEAGEVRRMHDHANARSAQIPGRGREGDRGFT